MKDKSNKVIYDFQNKRPTYKELGEAILGIMRNLIRDEIHTHQILYRVKTEKSLRDKLVRKNYKYNNLTDVTDILGLRIILYFEDDINAVENIIKQEFNIDEENSMDKRSFDADRFGYRSLHYIVSLNEKRLTLPEYRRFEGIKFEIQIRSILQHSWAEIEHDIGYKGIYEIPTNAKRTFYRIAALLEQADIEFTKLRSELNLYEEDLIEKISTENTDIKIDKSSLKAFILESKTLKDIELGMESFLCSRETKFYSPVVDNLLPKLLSHQITTITKLKSLLSIEKDNLYQWIKEQENLSSYKTFFQGSSILWLLGLLEEKRGTNASIIL